MKKSKFFVYTICLLFLFGCSVPLSQTQLLEPDITKQEVKNILADPYLTSFKNGYYIWDYHLQYALNSNYPYRLVFDPNEKLVWWGFNDEESERIIKAIENLKGTEALPFTIKVK